MDIIIHHNVNDMENVKAIKLDDRDAVFIKVTEDEAIHLASSLLQQISGMDSNAGRLESYDLRGTYFSVAVTKFNKKLYDDLLKGKKK